MQRLIGLVFLALFATYGYLATEIPLDFWAAAEKFNAQTLPLAISAGGALVSMLYVVLPGQTVAPLRLPSAPANWRLPGLITLLVLYAFLIEPIGFPVMTPGLLAGSMALLGERRIGVLLSVSLGVTALTWGILSLADIYLDPGILGQLL